MNAERSLELQFDRRPIKVLHPRRLAWCGFIPFLLLVSLLPVLADAVSPAADSARGSLARFVPHDSNLYAQLRDLRGLMQLPPFAAFDRFLQLPGGVAPAPDERLAPWLGRIKAIADIERDDLLRRYFGDEVAVAAPSWQRLADGVVLARLRDPDMIERLFARARGPVLVRDGGRRVCTLDRQDGLWLAARENTIVLGPSKGPGSYFLRVADLLTGQDDKPTLADEAQFVEVRDSLPPRARGWLFVRRAGGPPEAPAAASPHDSGLTRMLEAFFQRADYVGAAFEVGHDELRITAAGHAARDWPLPTADAGDRFRGFATPPTTLLSWRWHCDYASAYRSLSGSSRGGALRVLAGLAEAAAASVDLADDVLARLGPDSVLLVGYAEGSSAGTPFDLPLISLAVRVQAPDAAVLEVVTALAGRLADIANFQLLRAGREDLIRVIARRHEGVPFSSLAIGRFLGTQSDCPFLASLDVSWCIYDGWLIVSSHPAHLEQIIDAGVAARAEPIAAAPAAVAAVSCVSDVVVARPRAVARLIDNWVEYLRTAHPHVLEDGWWQLVRQRRGGARVQLGLGLKAEPNQPGKVLVALTLEGWPAFESISRGDLILGVDGQLLSTQDPLADFKRLVRHRKHLDGVVLRVEHEGKSRDVRIEIAASPGAEPSAGNPVQLLPALARLCHDFTLATYRLSFDRPGRFLAELTLSFDPIRPDRAMAPAVPAAPPK